MAEPRKVASQISALASGLTGAEVAELGVGLVLDGCEKTARSGGPAAAVTLARSSSDTILRGWTKRAGWVWKFTPKT